MTDVILLKQPPAGRPLTGALPSVSHAAAENRPPIPGSLGDVVRLDLVRRLPGWHHERQHIRQLPANVTRKGNRPGSNNPDLSPYTNNIIQVWTSGTGVNKDQEENGLRVH